MGGKVFQMILEFMDSSIIIAPFTAVVLVWFLLNVFGVGVSCRKLYSFVCLFICRR